MRERSIDALVCVLACSRTRVTDVREFSERSVARAWYTDDGGGGVARRRRERSRMNPYPVYHTAERRRRTRDAPGGGDLEIRVRVTYILPITFAM
jgi:hypothetical protein